MTYAKIIGTGSYVPEKVLTNDDLSRMLGEDINEFVSQVIGIRERHVCAENESTADLATAAARRALDAAGVGAQELDLIILATDTPEYISPATSVVVQQRLGAKRAGTFDINCACAGFVTALDAASKLKEGQFTKVRFVQKYPPEVNIEGWPAIVKDVLAKAGLHLEEVSLFLFTQVNLSTIVEVMKRLELPMERTHTVMQKWGYTGSACIPMVLDDAVSAGKLKPGQVVLMCASGGGLNMACAAFRF